MNRIPESARKTGVLLAGAGLIACAAVLIFLSIFGSESSETAQDGRSGSTQSAAPDTQKAPDTSDDALTVEKQPPAQPDDRTRISLPPYGTNSPVLDINLHPIAGLTPEEQQKANEEANRYVLPVTEYKGEPDIGDGISASGGKRLPSEIQAQVDRNASAVKAVRLNKIGLARLNARRAKQGLPALVAGRDVNVAPIGKDLVVEQSNFREPPKSGGGADSAETEVSGELLTGSETADLPPAGGASGAADNSELQYFPPIRDQGSVDSCVGWSEIYYATTHELAMAYGWDAKNGGDDYRLSPMFTYNFLNEGRDKYTYFTTHFNIARHHGVVRWSEMPNPGDYRKWVTDEDAYLEALKLKTDGYYGYSTIYSMSTTGLDTLKASLDNGHVAAFATFYRGWVFDTVDDDPNTTEDDDVVGLQIAHNLNNTSGGHGMVIVGYNDHLWLDLNNDGEVDANEKGGFKVANSDGTGWKDGGYCYITYDVVRNYSTITGHDGDGLVWQNRVRIAQPRSPQHEPTVVARITLNHTKRNQVKCQLGTSATSSTSPSAITSKIITDTPYEEVYQGVAYAFSGAAAASEDFTYYLDFTDELPSVGTPRRYYVIGTDRGTNDGNLTIKEF
ncbi:MAG TPA: C1 family peptidase [Tichowtungia sp.]|nr:C1 family peptidase [Tichowtungia sp.]